MIVINCLICSELFETGKKLCTHVRNSHNLSGDEYTVQYLYDGVQPQCQNCENLTRRIGYVYKKFCKDCSSIASSIGGKKGGTAPAWNRGQTKETDVRILAAAEKMTGENNPFFGKHHTQKTLQKLSEQKKLSADDFFLRVKQRDDLILLSSYDDFIDKQTKNLLFSCSQCKHEFLMSLLYVERQYQCPSCYKRVNSFAGKKHSVETIAFLADKQRLSENEFNIRVLSRENELIPITVYDDYTSRQNQHLSFECVICGTVNEKTLQAFENGSRCEKCFPLGSPSIAEEEIALFVESLGLDIKRHDRQFIKPLELNVFVPSVSVAIEYHGLYWHSGGRSIEDLDILRHRKKFLECEKKNVKLIQIFGDEWQNKRQICESMIANRLGVSKNKRNARACKIQQISSKMGTSFLKLTHIDGATQSKIYFGLFDEEELVGVLSLRKPITKKYGNVLELSRMSFSLNTIVRGGASKLIKHAANYAKEQGYSGLLSYAELRFGTGNVYQKCGFEKLPDTRSINYWYTDDITRFHRFKFRAQNGMSEKDFATANHVRPIYGAGNRTYVQFFV